MSNPKSNSIVEVTQADLPLHCPTPDAALWDSHPRVFIPIEESGDAKCPYCGTHFQLVIESGSARQG